MNTGGETVRSEAVSLLRSPGTHEPLRLVSVTASNGIAQEELISERSGQRFPIHEGIPLLLDESSLSGSNQRYQGAYNRAAWLYDPAIRLFGRLAGGGEGRFRAQYLRELEVQDGDRVLEVSIGTGANVHYLPEVASYLGVDISWGMLQQCQRNLTKWRRQAELILGNAEDLPLCDDAFDAVLHVGGINAFDNRAKAIREMIRVAKPGTKIVIVDESAKLMERFAWVPGARRILEEYRDVLAAPIGLVPEGMKDIQAKDIVRGNMYCLTFRKP